MSFEHPEPAEGDRLKPNVLAAELGEQMKSDLFALLSKVPQAVRRDLADAIADFSEQFNTFENQGHQLETPEATSKAQELIAKFRSFKI